MLYKRVTQLLGSLALAAAAASALAEPATMRIHHTSPANHQITMALHSFAEDVAAASAGRVVVDIVTKRTGRPVVEPQDYLRAVSSGEIEAASMPNFMWQPIPEMNFSLIPYYFTNAEQVRQFPGSDAAHFLDAKVARFGVQTLAWLDVSRSSVFTSNGAPIVSPQDLTGKHIATINEFGKTIFAPLKAEPVVIYSPQVADAVRAGKADVIMTDVASATGLKFYEVHKYATQAPFFSAFYHLFVNPKWLSGLPERDRAVVLAAAKRLEANAFIITEARAAASPDVLREGGMTVRSQSAAEIADWSQALRAPALQAFRASSPDAAKLIELLDRI